MLRRGAIAAEPYTADVKAVVLALLAAVVTACSSAGAERSARDLEWRTLPEVPTPRSEVAAAATGDGRILVVGGYAPPSSTVATVEIYDTAAGRWSTGPSLPIAVNHAMAASAGDAVYVFGGYTGAGAVSDQAFAFRNGGWEPLPPMPEARAAGGAATAGSGGSQRIYVVGGLGQSGHATSTLVFDPGSETWSTLPGLRQPRDHLGVAGTPSSVFAVGGRTSAGNLATAEELPVADGEWRPLADMPTARGGMAATATRGGLVVAAGGEDLGAGGETFDEVEALTAGGSERSWMVLPSLPTPRHGLGVVAVGDTVYVLAGGRTPGLSFSGTNEAITLVAVERLRCAGRTATLVGSARRDTLAGGRGHDVILSQGGEDTVRGAGGADRLCGGTGSDRLRGGPGRDRLVGGGGADRLAGGGGLDRCIGRDGGRCER